MKTDPSAATISNRFDYLFIRDANTICRHSFIFPTDFKTVPKSFYLKFSDEGSSIYDICFGNSVTHFFPNKFHRK
jgi:hypothetical protein